MAEDFLALVTRKSWREELAALLLGKLSPAELKGRSEREQLMLRWFFNRDPHAAVEYYASKNRPIPASIGTAILEDRKPKKGGRHSHPEERARQKASDIACFLAVQYLLEKGIKLTPAGVQIGRLMNLSRQAVLGAWQRQKDDPEFKRQMDSLEPPARKVR